MLPGTTAQELCPAGLRSFQPVRSLPLNRGRKSVSVSAALSASGVAKRVIIERSGIFVFIIKAELVGSVTLWTGFAAAVFRRGGDIAAWESSEEISDSGADVREKRSAESIMPFQRPGGRDGKDDQEESQSTNPLFPAVVGRPSRNRIEQGIH
jgi:hypothetical protein